MYVYLAIIIIVMDYIMFDCSIRVHQVLLFSDRSKLPISHQAYHISDCYVK